MVSQEQVSSLELVGLLKYALLWINTAEKWDFPTDLSENGYFKRTSPTI
jgi:hypothetical protein